MIRMLIILLLAACLAVPACAEGLQGPMREDQKMAPDDESAGNPEEMAGRKSRADAAARDRKGNDRELEKLDSLGRMMRLLPSVWPADGRVTSVFGPRRSPFTGKLRFHSGMDIAMPSGTPVRAPADGKVIFSGRDGGYGISVELAHWGGIITRHAHLSKAPLKPGTLVRQGDVIGYSGSTGMSTGPHLHYEVIVQGVPTNPMRHILE